MLKLQGGIFTTLSLRRALRAFTQNQHKLTEEGNLRYDQVNFRIKNCTFSKHVPVSWPPSHVNICGAARGLR